MFALESGTNTTFEVFTANISTAVFGTVTDVSSLKMKAAGSSEESLTTRKSTRSHNLEDHTENK